MEVPQGIGERVEAPEWLSPKGFCEAGLVARDPMFVACVLLIRCRDGGLVIQRPDVAAPHAHSGGPAKALVGRQSTRRRSISAPEFSFR